MGKKFLIKNTFGRYGYTELINDNGHMYNKFTDLFPNVSDETLKKLKPYFNNFSLIQFSFIIYKENNNKGENGGGLLKVAPIIKSKYSLLQYVNQGGDVKGLIDVLDYLLKYDW